MSFSLGYLCMDRSYIDEYEEHGPLVDIDNICIGRRVCRGRHWSRKWQKSISGTIIGYVDDNGFVGENVFHQYNQVQQNQEKWCVVALDNGKKSVYPVGAEGIFALSYEIS